MHVFTARPPEEKNALIHPLKDGLLLFKPASLYLDSGPVFTAVAIITACGTRYFTFKRSHKMKRIVTLLDPLVFESLLGQSN